MKIVTGNTTFVDQEESSVNFNKIYGSYVVTLSCSDNYNVFVKDKSPSGFTISASTKITGDVSWKILVKE